MKADNFAVTGADLFIREIGKEEVMEICSRYKFDYEWNEDTCKLTNKFENTLYVSREELIEILFINRSYGEELCRLHGGEFVGSELYLKKINF